MYSFLTAIGKENSVGKLFRCRDTFHHDKLSLLSLFDPVVLSNSIIREDTPSSQYFTSPPPILLTGKVSLPSFVLFAFSNISTPWNTPIHTVNITSLIRPNQLGIQLPPAIFRRVYVFDFHVNSISCPFSSQVFSPKSNGLMNSPRREIPVEYTGLFDQRPFLFVVGSVTSPQIHTPVSSVIFSKTPLYFWNHAVF